MRLYISGPMTGYPKHNFDQFNIVAESLRCAGYKVDNPAEFGEPDDWTWDEYLRRDLAVLLKLAEGVAVLPDAQFSRGAQLEVHVAMALGLPVFPVWIWLFKAEQS